MISLAEGFWAGLGDYLRHVSPALLGVLLGGFIVQRYWIRRANEAAFIEYLSRELSDLVDETIEYWSLDCQAKTEDYQSNRRTSRKLEQKIKASIKNLNSLLLNYAERYCKKIAFTPLMEEVLHACTSGKFETLARAADTDRFLMVINATHRVRMKLLERKV